MPTEEILTWDSSAAPGTILPHLRSYCAISHQRPDRHLDLAITPQAPVQVELLASLDIGKLAPGASVFAKARVDWNQPTCHLRAGSMVVGHIVDLQRRTKEKTRVQSHHYL